MAPPHSPGREPGCGEGPRGPSAIFAPSPASWPLGAALASTVPKAHPPPTSPGSHRRILDQGAATLCSKSPMDQKLAGSPALLNGSKSHSVLFILIRTCCPDASICQSCVASPQSATQTRSVPWSSGKKTDPSCLKGAVITPAPPTTSAALGEEDGHFKGTHGLSRVLFGSTCGDSHFQMKKQVQGDERLIQGPQGDAEANATQSGDSEAFSRRGRRVTASFMG